MSSDHAPSFLDYVPVKLAFGTSGLRGLVTDITDLEAYINVKGALRYLLSIEDIAPGSTVAVAGDLRPSTDRIMRASAQAILDAGCAVENAGKIPTPALVFHSLGANRAGVMVTGSHIPFDRNGIKVNKRVGEVLKSDEAGITREVERVRAEEYRHDAKTSAFDAHGAFKQQPELPERNTVAEENYVRRYTGSFHRAGLAGMRVLFYQHSAVGRDLLPRILSELGAEVVTAGRSEKFIPIDTENVTDEQLDRLEELLSAAEADEPGGTPFTAIVSTDGDSDRPLMAAVLDREQAGPDGRRVRFLSGDLLGIVVAEYIKADAVAVPISSNDGVERRMRERGALVQKSKIGSPYVVSAIDELRRGEYARIVGWEANGGFLIGSEMAFATGPLAALPTRDATLPILANLFAAAEERVTLAELWNQLPARHGRAGLLDNVPVTVGKAILARLIPAGSIVEVEIDPDGRIFTRDAAGTIALDEPAAADWRDSVATLASFFVPALGFDAVARINVLDGVRVYFRNGDVAHVRPSGNAPQLRIYANSDSQGRADQIVEQGLHEPDGILRRMEKAFT